MARYIAKRILYMIPVLLGVTLLVFFIMHLAPGNVAGMILGENATPEQIAALEHEMGLDRPLLVQYFDYLVGLLHGDLGTSYTTGDSVTGEIMARFPYTVLLTLVAAVVSILLALPLGILAAVKQNTWVDNVSMVVSLIGVSMPIFWLAVMLILLFSLKLGWFPVYGADSWKSIVLPAISLGFMNMASIARTTRSSMVETIRQDYIRTAYAKGLWGTPWTSPLPGTATTSSARSAAAYPPSDETRCLYGQTAAFLCDSLLPLGQHHRRGGPGAERHARRPRGRVRP